jgi:hypothetical protein
MPTLLGLDFLRQEQIYFYCYDKLLQKPPDKRSFIILHDSEYRSRNSDPSVVSCGDINPTTNKRGIRYRTVTEGLEFIREVPGVTRTDTTRIFTVICMLSSTSL